MVEQEVVKNIPVDMIQRGRYQPRQEFDEDALVELSMSIRAQGLVQPIIVRIVENERLELVCGERRWRASQHAGLHEIPAIVRRLTDKEAMAQALIENLQREDLNLIEESNYLQRYVDEFGLTQQQIADEVGCNRTEVAFKLRLRNFPLDLQSMIKVKDLPGMSFGHAKVLMVLDSPKMQMDLSRLSVANEWTVRELEERVKSHKEMTGKKVKVAATEDPNIRRLFQELSEHLGTKLVYKYDNKRDSGSFTVHFHSTDSLQGILEKINFRAKD